MKREPYDPRVLDVVGELAELAPGAHRDARLAVLCGDDEHLRERVRLLLSVASEDAGEVSHSPPLSGDGDRIDWNGPPPALSADHLDVGDQIGPYTIVHRVGEGGMGVVYRAEQRSPVRRIVALKLIKLGMDTRAVIARFEAERQALALMQHPHVARVFDAGTSDRGRPYFAMEFVSGEPINDYCDRNRLTLRQRLELFRKVCDAIQHAHTKGIIHRDLKPSNVLVSVDEGSTTPTPKVIDFGIAKATQRSLTERTLHTELGQLVGTPEYMSPEQAEAGGSGDVDTRSDVYSLGVMLYELLTGTLPFEPQTLRRASYGEVRRIIRDIEPPRPSTRLSSLDAAQAGEIARCRTAAIGSLRAELQRELEWIPLKAMRKDRTQRYRSPSELGDDIGNYLASRPLIAGPESPAYRLRKLVRRNRGAVIAAAAVLAVLVAGIAVSTTLAIRLKRSADAIRLEQQRTLEQKAEAERKRIEAEDARSTSDQVVEVFRQLLINAAPSETRGQPVNVNGLTDRAVRSIEGRFSDRPAIEAQLRGTIGTLYNQLGRYDEALAQARLALAAAERAGGQTSWTTIGMVRNLADALMRSNRRADAEQIVSQALAALDAADPKRERKRERANLLYQLANARSRPEMAAPGVDELYRQAIALARDCTPPDEDAVVSATNGLGLWLVAQQKPDEAIALLQACASGLAQRLGGDHPLTIDAKLNLGVAYTSGRDFPKALSLFREAGEIGRHVLGQEHPTTVKAVAHQAQALAVMGQTTEAEALFAQLYPIADRVYGAETPEATDIAGMYGLVLRLNHKPEEAARILEPTVERSSRVFGPESLKTLGYLYELAQALQSTMMPQRADASFKRLTRIGIEAKALPTGLRAQAISAYGEFLAQTGRHEDAIASLEDACERINRLGPDALPTLAAVRARLAGEYAIVGRGGSAISRPAQSAPATTTASP